ncbi:type III-A CRISPR-associated RAMP protein Csm4 [Desulfovulcanus sp.]
MLLFKLQFKSALHVDSKGSGESDSAQEFIHSDTLSAALSLAWATLYGQKSEDFFLNLPFRVSSAFPYIGDTLFFPVPCWDIWQDVPPEKRKEIKAVRWISQRLFEEVLSGRLLDIDQVHQPCSNLAISPDEKNSTANWPAITWVIAERQRGSIDRLGLPRKGGLFFFALQFFAPECGLYFLGDIDFENEQKLCAVVRFLGDTGIGADRNCGLGHFSLKEQKGWLINLPRENTGWITLSLFNPGARDDLQALTRQTAYNLVIRSGWIVNSGIARPPVRAFAEGSYFSAKPEGRILPMLDEKLRQRLGLDHSAPRDFRAFVLPCVKRQKG